MSKKPVGDNPLQVSFSKVDSIDVDTKETFLNKQQIPPSA